MEFCQSSVSNMAGNPPEGLGDDFFEQILAVPPSYSTGGADSAGGGYGDVGSMPMVLQLGSGGSSSAAAAGGGSGGGGYRGVGMGMGMPLGLNLEQGGFIGQERFRELREEVEANTNNNINTSNVSASVSSAMNVSRTPLYLDFFLSFFLFFKIRMSILKFPTCLMDGICLPFLVKWSFP